MADYLNIAGRVRTTASDGVAMEAQEVKDLNLNKSQQEINADVQTELDDRYTKEETYSKEQLDDLITTPDVNHVSVVATNATTAVTDILPATGEADTIYRVGNWNGTQYDTTMYALFAWNGTTYVCLAVRSFVGEVYDVSVNHPDAQGNPTPYADLAAALGTNGENIPADIRRGGMSIKFIQGTAQTSDNKYVQFMYLGTSTAAADFTNVANWEKVNLKEELKQLGGAVVNRVRKSDYCDVEDYTQQGIEMTTGFYNYKLTPVSYVSDNRFKCIKITDVKAGDMYQFSGKIAYSLLAAVVFMDSQDNCIGYLYGDNTSTTISFDTGIISIPVGCSSVAFNAYIGGGIIPTLKKYTLPKVLTENKVNNIVLNVVNPDDDMKPNHVLVDVGHYYDGNTLAYTENAAFSCASANVGPTDKVSYNGKVRYGALYAVIFADDLGNIISRIGHGQSSTTLTVDTGIIPVPPNATKVYFGAYGNTFTAYIYKEPAFVNEVSFQEYYAKGQDNVRYCNPYHYVMGVSQPDDLVNSGFDASFESSTAGAFLIHNKYFRSYRRKHEWHVKLSSTSVVRFGIGNNNSSIVVNSRQSQFMVDVPNSLLKIYTSGGEQVDTVALGAIDATTEYILRYEQYDYITRVRVINKATLGVVASYTTTATPENSLLGKLLGKPFIELQAGSLKVTQYNCYLMDKPKVVFIGDSITECGYRQDTYAAMLIRENLNNNGCIIAQGGANNDVLAFAKAAELKYMKPEYLSLLVGTNGTITAEQIQAWVSFCQENDIKLIFNCVPVSLDEDDYPWATKNATIRSQGILGANFDYATALNNNPDDGGNPVLFADNVHPNADGQKAMYERFLNDVRLF